MSKGRGLARHSDHFGIRSSFFDILRFRVLVGETRVSGYTCAMVTPRDRESNS